MGQIWSQHTADKVLGRVKIIYPWQFAWCLEHNYSMSFSCCGVITDQSVIGELEM
jgi:hypothetical protein